MTVDEKKVDSITVITRRLFWCSILVTITVVTLIVIAFKVSGEVPLIGFAFLCDVGGGLLSMQSRLTSLSEVRLAILRRSVVATCLPLFHGGLFAVLLYVMFIAGIIGGALFPEFHNPVPFSEKSNNFVLFFEYTNPKSYKDVAKVIIWSAIAGYSEGFVRGLLRRASDKTKTDGSSTPAP